MPGDFKPLTCINGLEAIYLATSGQPLRLCTCLLYTSIDKSCLIEPELHSKVRRMPNGRKKLVEKRIVRHPDISGLISDGSIVVDELCGIDAEASDYRPRIYMRLLRIILEVTS